MTRRKSNQTKSMSRREEMREIASSSDYKRLKNEESSEDEYKTGERRLIVYIYESEIAKIKNWVLLRENIETGGDLFGLWVDSRTAVVQFALGPGENCKRYETAFFQDLDYLAEAGGYLTKKHGLCNLGQWHSHHQLSLNKPSHGDENTVWGHMPTLGLNRYIVCIANISSGWNTLEASVNCFLFELDDNQQLPVLQGKFRHLNQASPVDEDPDVKKEIAKGAEILVPSVYKDSSESCWSSFKRTVCSRWSRFTKWVRTDTCKALAILAFIVAPFAITVFVIFYIRPFSHTTTETTSPTGTTLLRNTSSKSSGNLTSGA